MDQMGNFQRLDSETWRLIPIFQHLFWNTRGQNLLELYDMYCIAVVM